jgi:uncharacterized protein (DUF1330 family)
MKMMKTRFTVALSMLAGFALGAVSVGELYPQSKATGAYAVFALSDVGDPAAWKTNVTDPAGAVIAKYGGRFIIRTNEVHLLRANEPPVKRVAVIAFDTVQQAKTWWDADDMKSIRSYEDQHSKGPAVVIEAASQ